MGCSARHAPTATRHAAPSRLGTPSRWGLFRSLHAAEQQGPVPELELNVYTVARKVGHINI
eukprot:82494-Pelagomonas_calceolata.AAC.2